MPGKRILSLWFPRLGAERILRRIGAADADMAFAVLRDTGQMQVIDTLNHAASRAGLRPGQALRDARAICPDLVTRLQNSQAEAAFLAALRRWCGQFSPFVAEAPPDGLMLDITGCAHLFGGEPGLIGRIATACGRHGLSLRAAIADTPGAAWALARHAGAGPDHPRSGDAVDQEARATRSRAARRPRHPTGGGAAPLPLPLPPGPRGAEAGAGHPIAPPGQTRSALADLPVQALRLEPETAAALLRLGLRRIGDLAGQPRGPLARRFGSGLMLRLDQALGAVPEPIGPQRPDTVLATRLTLPDPIGLAEDVAAAVERLLPRLCQMLEARGLGARWLQLQGFRSDGTLALVDLGLAVPTHDPARIRPLLALKLEGLDAGYGIDILRLEATRTEPVHAQQHAGHDGLRPPGGLRATRGPEIEDLIARLGTRIGLDAITRRHPGDSHIPEKGALTLSAAWSEAAPRWPDPPAPRPLRLWRPEPVTAPDRPALPGRFRWRRQMLDVAAARGPERIAPEWWLDDPLWRSGTRDYWVVTTRCGARLWLCFAHGGAIRGGWFCQGSFA